MSKPQAKTTDTKEAVELLQSIERQAAAVEILREKRQLAESEHRSAENTLSNLKIKLTKEIAPLLDRSTLDQYAPDTRMRISA